MAKLAILAEDEDQVRKFVKTVLTQQGYAVEDFPDGDAAWTRIQDKTKPFPDLLVTDNDVPASGRGVQLIQQVRALGSHGTSLPAVLMSGIDVSAAAAMPSVSATFVKKPMPIAAIVQAIADASQLVAGSAPLSPAAQQVLGAGPKTSHQPPPPPDDKGPSLP